jgi:ADP-ribose pyrophosphatase YjhB (NUDIX family)
MEIKIHDFQISILRELLFKPGARFRDLKKVDVTNDHFSFHINHLIKEGLIIKNDGKYSLTDTGKEFANRMDTDALKLERQAKLGVSVHAERIVKGKKQFLVHHRLKEPFFGWWGFNTGKIRWGETPDETAERELLEETGLTGKFTLKGIVHYFHVRRDKKLLEDKYFWVFKAEKLRGKLKEKVNEGENVWMDEKAYRKLKNVFASFDEISRIQNAKKLIYLDVTKVVETY